MINHILSRLATGIYAYETDSSAILHRYGSALTGHHRLHSLAGTYNMKSVLHVHVLNHQLGGFPARNLQRFDAPDPVGICRDLIMDEHHANHSSLMLERWIVVFCGTCSTLLQYCSGWPRTSLEPDVYVDIILYRTSGLRNPRLMDLYQDPNRHVHRNTQPKGLSAGTPNPRRLASSPTKKVKQTIRGQAFITHLPPIDRGQARLARPHPGGLFEKAAAAWIRTLDPETAACYLTSAPTLEFWQGQDRVLHLIGHTEL